MPSPFEPHPDLNTTMPARPDLIKEATDLVSSCNHLNFNELRDLNQKMLAEALGLPRPTTEKPLPTIEEPCTNCNDGFCHRCAGCSCRENRCVHQERTIYVAGPSKARDLVRYIVEMSGVTKLSARWWESDLFGTMSADDDLEAIRKADAVWVLINPDLISVGSMYELGYAQGLERCALRIFVFGTPKSIDRPEWFFLKQKAFRNKIKFCHTDTWTADGAVDLRKFSESLRVP